MAKNKKKHAGYKNGLELNFIGRISYFPNMPVGFTKSRIMNIK